MSFDRFHLRIACAAALLIALQSVDAAPENAAADSARSQTAPSDATGFSPEKLEERKINFPELPDKGGLFGGSESISSPSSPPVPMTRRRSQAELDEKNNWAFMTADDVVRNLTVKDAGQAPDVGPDGRDRNSYSAVERFFDRMAAGNRNTGSSLDPSDANPLNPLQNEWSGSRTPAFGGTSPSFTPGGAFPGLQNQTPGYSSLANPLNTGSYGPTPDLRRQRDSHQRHLESFKKLLAPPTPPTGLTPMQPGSAGLGGSPGFGTAGTFSPSGPSGFPTSLEQSTIPSDVDYSPPTSPAQSPSRPPTDFSAPRRPF